MTIGLDLGSDQFRSMRTDSNQLFARQCPAVFVTISDTPAHRRLLQQSNTRFALCSDQLLVFGDEAQEWSAMLNLSVTPLLRGGRIPASDPISRQVLTLMIDALLPAPVTLGSLCRMTVPGSGFDEQNVSRDAEFFQQLVSLRGYRPQLTTATQALALAELNEDSFTGIAINIGHATCEFGVVHCGREIVRSVVMSGLEDFDIALKLDGANPSGEQIASPNIEREYIRFFTDVVTEAQARFEQDRTLKTLPQLMPVVCAGGITSSPSFLRLFQPVWNERHWNFSTKPIRVAKDPNLAVVRGCLIQAELDEPSERRAA